MLTNKLHGCSTAWRVLITDAYGLKVISSCARMSDLAEVGVSGTSRWLDEFTRGSTTKARFFNHPDSD